MDVAWDDLRTVLMLVRYQTLAAAAAALDVNYTTVARRIRRAEASLGQVLFERLADGYRPTEAARVVASHAEKMETSEFCQRRTKTAPVAGAIVHHFAGFGRSKTAPLFGIQVCP